MLLIHADAFDYQVREKALEQPEELNQKSTTGTLRDGIVAFCTVEKRDEAGPERIAEKAAASIAEVAGWLKTTRIMIYPYAHLSSELGGKGPALRVLDSIQGFLEETGMEVSRSPFGWHKSFNLVCKGHPLSEVSRIIELGEKPQPTPVKTLMTILDQQGELHRPEEYSFKDNSAEFRTLVEREVFKREARGGEAKYIDYCRRFGVEWESYSDLGHMRYGPESTLILELLSDYAWKLANSLGFPVFHVKGTNMFDLSVPPIQEHAQLFGSRAYEVKVDEKSFVMRYAACHQQFSMIKDWTLSYKHLPFGTFEVADSYRLEQSGELLLCFRLRKFLMPDLHIYLRSMQEAIEHSKRIHNVIYEEIRKLGRDYVSIYNTTRDFFEANREYFRELVEVEKKPVLVNFVPEGVYYWVMNVEYCIIDELNRPREIGTFQIDIGNAKRFGIAYADASGEKQYPVIIHTALIGALERYLFTLFDTAVRVEKGGGKPMLPYWISPTQVRIIPVRPEFLDSALKLAEGFEKKGVRVDIDDRDETVERRVRDAELAWVPYSIVMGRREASGDKFTVRIRQTNEQIEVRLSELETMLMSKQAEYPRQPLTIPRLLSMRPGYKRF